MKCFLRVLYVGSFSSAFSALNLVPPRLKSSEDNVSRRMRAKTELSVRFTFKNSYL